MAPDFSPIPPSSSGPATPDAVASAGAGDPGDTRARILEAAGQVFAEVGFRDATVREICARAGANLAAINYHFRDKHGLYTEVFERARCVSDTSWLDAIHEAAGRPARERLGLFIAGFVHKLLDPGRPGWHAKLISREMIEPTGVLDVLIERSIRPQFELLCSIVSELLGTTPDAHASYLCAASVMGQCLHYHHTREVTQRLCPGFYDDPQITGLITSHITAFSLHAIDGVAADLGRGGSPA